MFNEQIVRRTMFVNVILDRGELETVFQQSVWMEIKEIVSKSVVTRL